MLPSLYDNFESTLANLLLLWFFDVEGGCVLRWTFLGFDIVFVKELLVNERLDDLDQS